MDALFSLLLTIFWLAVALGILVFIHELGHFLTARMFGMRVDAFSLGMPPNVFRKTVGDTEYRLGALPLGGYVSIAGMVDESMNVPYEMEPVLDDDGRPVYDTEGDPLMAEVLDENGRPVPADTTPEPDEFRAKPVWQRMIVISAGVVCNVALAFAIYSALAFTYGKSYLPAEDLPLDVIDGSIAEEIGFRAGDRFVALDDEPVTTYEGAIRSLITSSPETVTVARGDGSVDLPVPTGLMTRLSIASRETDEDNLFRLFGALPVYPAILAGVQSGTPAEAAGLRAGDRIVSIAGTPVREWDEIAGLVAAAGGAPTPIRWARPDSLAAAGDPTPLRRANGEAVYEADITPRESGGRYLLGITRDDTVIGRRFETLGVGESLQAGADQTVGVITSYVGFIGKLFSGQESFRENVGGPIVIAQQSKEMADRGGSEFWGFVAYLSVALAVFNILPIPALDGGHIVFLVYEAVARREPSLKVRMVVQQVGLALILAIMAFVIFNDALRLFG